MAEKLSLAAEKRKKGKSAAKALRSQGKIPAVVYGPKTDPFEVAVNYSDFLKLFRKAGTSTVISLEVEGKPYKVLVQDYALDPVKDTFIHVDFLALDLKEKVIVTVPVVFEGEAPAVKNFGGVLTVSHPEIEIRCFPDEIPHEIKVDISKLEHVHDTITVADLNLPESLEVMYLEPDAVICSITGKESEGENEEAAEGGEEAAAEAPSEAS